VETCQLSAVWWFIAVFDTGCCFVGARPIARRRPVLKVQEITSQLWSQMMQQAVAINGT